MKKKKITNRGQLALIKKIKENGKGLGGRPKGSRNKFSALLQQAVPEAVERLGSDGNGKDELIGWLMGVAQKETVAYLQLLGKVLPLEREVLPAPKELLTREELVMVLKSRGMPMPKSLIDTGN